MSSERVGSPRSAADRFAWFASVGVALTSVPYLWVLWDLWSGSVDPLRSEPYYANFYDLQARAIFAGHLWLPNGSAGIEAFVHGGRQYTYFGLFPTLIRIPVLALTHGLDGKLTAPSMLLAWLFTALFSALLVWRVRVMGRPDAPLGRAEAASLGALVACVTGGSAIVYLAAAPWVYNEDLAWSVALTTASLFALLGFVERPSWRRAALAGVFVLAAALDRAPAGYGCEIAALLTAAWFATGRAGIERKRWSLPALAVAIIPLALAGLVNTAKFGSPFALPMASQVWTTLNAHRRQFLAANGGKAFSFGFLPSTLDAYFNPTALHFSAVFPFVTLPTTPAAPVAGAFLDQTFPTTSVTASMPLLFVLGCWGVVTVVRPRPPGALRLARPALIGAAAACAGALLWGYIADRYLADFIPLLLLTAAVGVADIWRRLDGRTRALRASVCGAVVAGATLCVLVNVAAATTPAPVEWNNTQGVNFVTFQQKVGNLVGHPLAGTVVRGGHLPDFAPAGRLYDFDGCSGLYLSSGYSYATIPDEQYEHMSWIPVEQGSGAAHRLTMVFEPALVDWTAPFAVLADGRTTVIARVAAIRPGGVLVIDLNETDPHIAGKQNRLAKGTSLPVYAQPITVRTGQTYPAYLVTDPALDQLSLSISGQRDLVGPLSPGGPLVLRGTRDATGSALVSVVRRPDAASVALCERLAGA